MSKKDRSLERNKKTLSSLANLIGKEMIAGLIPGGSAVYGICEILHAHWNERINDRTSKFHLDLLEGMPKQEKEKLFERPFLLDDYYALLSNSVQDAEEAKVKIYSRLFKAIIIGSVPDSFKLHFIKSVREFTTYDIDVMREMYIRATHNVCEKGDIFPLQKFLETNDPIRNIAIQTLIRQGFLLEDTRGERRLHLSELLKVFVKIIFEPDELTPESIG